MKRYKLDRLGDLPHFIGSWSLEPIDICDELVQFFEANPASHETGKTYNGVNKKHKDSTDLAILPNQLDNPEFEIVRKYIECLYECYSDYVKQWPFLKRVDSLDVSAFNIQRYHKGEHFKRLHTERLSLANSHRLLAWMTYLNDVPEGGATHFAHYDLDVQPERGKTLIWPAEWTHAHRGNVVTQGEKYIITGWMHLKL